MIFAAAAIWGCVAVVVGTLIRTHVRWTCAILIVGAGISSSAVLLHFGSGSSVIRAIAGALVAMALSAGAVIVISPGTQIASVVTLATTAGLCLIAVGTDDPVISASAMMAMAGALSIRWMSAVPGRYSLAAVRMVGAGAAGFLAITPFTPISATAVGPWPDLVAGLVVVAAVGLLGLLPNGWASAIGPRLAVTDLVTWALIVVPTTLVLTGRWLSSLPEDSGQIAEHFLIVLGLATAVWSAGHAFNAVGNIRYVRVLVSDIGLATAAIASSSAAIPGLELLALCHVVVLPTLASGSVGGVVDLSWFALGSIPPSPGSWARLSLVFACAAAGGVSAGFAIVAVGVVAVATTKSIFHSRSDSVSPTNTAPFLGFTLAGVAALIAVIPSYAARVVFGG